MEAATQMCSLNTCSWKVKKKKKTQENTCEKVHVHVYFSKILRKLKVVSSCIYGKNILSRNNSFFLNKNLKVFETENRKFWAKRNHASFLVEDKF